MPDDALVAKQPRDVPLPVSRDALGIEAGERRPEVFPLAEDREPRQAGLEPFEAESLEQATLVGYGTAPFLVVVGDVQRVGRRPAARRFRQAALFRQA